MKNKFRIKLLITCLFALVLSLSLFAFACNNDANDSENTLSATPFKSQTSNDPANAEGLKHIYDYIPEYKTYEGITVDGVVGEEEWAGKNKISYSFVQANQTYNIELSTDFNKDGFVMYTKVSGGPIYYNYGRGSTLNTGIEYYVASSGSGHTGININHRTWEIDITAGGYFLTKIRNCPGARENEAWRIYVVPLDVDITLLGTLNDSNSTEGFVFEWFMPWYALGDSTPPTSIYVLPAYLYAASKTSTGSVWVDTIKEGLGVSGSWGNYSKRLEFTENGYKDPNDKTLPVNIMNETPDYGTVTYTGSKESGATVTAVPNEGYEVESFNVNGKTITGMSTTLLPNSFTGLSVMVKFKKASSTRPKLNFTATFTATGAPLNYSIEGKKVRLSTTYAEQVATITNSKASFNLPAGNYTVTMEDLPLLTDRVTVTASTTTINANLKVDAFVKNATISSLTTDDNGTDIIFLQGAGQQNAQLNTELGKVVWLQAKIGKIFETSIAETGGTYIATNGLSFGTVWNADFENDGWRFRFAGDYWTSYQMTDAEYMAFCNNSLEIAVSIGNGIMYGYARANSSSEWRLIGSKATSGESITGIATNHQSPTSKALDVQYALESITDTGMINVTTTVSTGAETGSATAGMANYGGVLVIKQSPKEGYRISSVTIDGISYDYYLVYNLPTAESDVVIKGLPAKYSYNVEVGFVSTTPTDTITINVQTIKSVNGSSAKEKYVGKLTFINSDGLHRTYTLSSGLIKTNLLAPGTYRVVASNDNYSVYHGQQITISASQKTYDVLLSYQAISNVCYVNESTGTTETAILRGTYNVDRVSEGIVTSNNGTAKKNTYMYFNPELGAIKYAVATIKLKPSQLAGLDVFGGFYTGGALEKSPVGVEYTGDGPAGYVLRYVSNGVDGSTSNQFQIRTTGSIGWSAKTMKTVTSESDLEYTITIAMYLDGTTARLYYKTTGALTFGQVNLVLTQGLKRLSSITMQT
ncbi:MAG: hypothetical protein J6V68_00210 [Clostridia bacterium]|nr:hypothetical protein [Clostridia bacterium]